MQLIIMKRGGQIIYSGMLGRHSSKLIEYFEVSQNLNAIPANIELNSHYIKMIVSHHLYLVLINCVFLIGHSWCTKDQR